MTNRALVALLRVKGRLGRFDHRMLNYYNVPGAGVNANVKKFIARGYGHGLVPTATTNGKHAPTSFHKLGDAADMGLRKELVGTKKGRKRLVKFQRGQLKAFRRGHRPHMQELLGPDNRAAVLKGRETDLKEGTALENQHDNHVHGALTASVAHKPKPRPRLPTVMYDSVDIHQMPQDAPAVAGYIGGRFQTFHQLAEAFPHARRVSIAVASTFDADVLDVEPGDAPPALAPAWVKRQHARGVKRPGVYTSVSNAQALVNLLAQNGIKRSSYRLWTAHYTFHPHLCDKSCGFGMRTRADATQWTDKALGRNLDQSKCAGSWWR